VLLVLLAMTTVQRTGAAPLSDQSEPAATRGVPWTGEPGITETVASLMERDRRAAALGPRQVPIKPLMRPNRRNPPQNPDSSAAAQVQPAPNISEQVAGPFTPQGIGLGFTGATLADKKLYPPDTMGAVGPTQFIVAVNNRFRSFNKATGVADGALDLDPDVFFAAVKTPVTGSIIGNFTSDPHIRYDRLSGRWFIVMIDVPNTSSNPFTTAPNRVLVAVSSGSTIVNSSSFTLFQFQHDTVSTAGDTGDFADYPTLGIDANALYIGDNVYNAAGTAFVGCSGFVVRKSSILGTGPIVVTAFRGLVPSSSSEGPYTPQGVDNYDPAATEGYFIGTSMLTSGGNGQNLQSGRLVVRRVSTPGATPTISGNLLITTAKTRTPIKVPHLGNTAGTNGNLDPVDDRLFAAHIRNGRLWTAHNIQVNSSGTASSSGGRNGSRWYELQNLTGTPSVVEYGTVFDSASSNAKSYWIPSIMVSGQGHVAMGFSTAGTNYRVNAGTVGRLATDALNTMQTPVEYTASSTAYNPPGDPGGQYGRRWGDFSYTSLDPNDDMTMWTIQEFCDSTNSYGVRVVRLIAPPPATPASVSPASLTIGQSNVNVTLTGTQSAGSGFFDPGAGFSNRIAALVNGGGVTVNSITFTSATSITLNLSVALGAAAGARTITVTNPDGQSTTSASGLLTLNKSTPTVSTWPSASAIAYGQTLADSTLSGGSASVSGSFAFTTSTTAPNVGTAAQSVTFTPTDSSNYGTVTGSVSVNVTKATPSVTTWPTASNITYEQTLAASTLSGGAASPAGTFAFTTPATAPNAGTAPQSVTFTPTDSSNYDTAAGNVSVTVAQAAATVTLGDLTQTYDGTPKSASATTDPLGLSVALTYDGSATAPTNVGDYGVVATVMNPNYQGAANGTLSILPETLAEWKARYFTPEQISAGQADDDADPDHDGLVNLAEYALGANPLAFTPPLTAVRNESGLVLTFQRPKGLPDVQYAAESSEDMIQWSPCTLEMVTDGPVQTMQAVDPLTSGNPAQRFIRLRFTTP